MIVHWEYKHAEMPTPAIDLPAGCVLAGSPKRTTDHNGRNEKYLVYWWEPSASIFAGWEGS